MKIAMTALTSVPSNLNMQTGKLASLPEKKYQSLYRFLGVLEGQQIHKLYKVAMGVLDPSAFTAEEIKELERRMASQQIHRVSA